MNILLTGPAGLFREGIASLLRGVVPDAQVTARDSLERPAPEADKPDCIVLDGDGLREANGELDTASEHARLTPVIVLVDRARRQQVEELIVAGMAGCVEKSASADVLFGAVRVALAGGVYLPRPLLAIDSDSGNKRAALKAVQSDANLHLTARQIEVLALLARGRSNKVIARELDVAEATVKTHLTTIFKALNVSSRGEASAAAARIAKVRDTQAGVALNGHAPIGRLLAKMDARHFRAKEILFRKGDPSGALFYVEKGTVELREFGIELGAGTVLGEIGLFSPEHRRTCTAVCRSGCEMRVVSADDAVRLYYQEPEFALHLLQLIVRRLQADSLRHG